MVKNGSGYSDYRTLKLTVYQEVMQERKIREVKSYFNNFWVVMVKNRGGLLGLGMLKSAVYQG